MTTTAEVRQILNQYPAEAQRVLFKPSALLGSEEGLDDLAREVVALANRDGGRLVLGVSESGQFEGRIELSREQVDAAVETLLTTRMIPRPETVLEHLTGEEGELVVLRVEPRAGAPHAFARVTSNGSVGGRAYFVRDGNRTRAATEAQLGWMFRVSGDPALRREMALDLHTRAGELGIVADVPQPRAAGYFAMLLEGVPAKTAARLGGDPQARSAALTELAGWAFLLELQALFGDGTEVESEEVALDDLPVPAGGSAFGAEGPDLRQLLDGDRKRGGLAGLLGRRGPGRSFRLPRGAEVQVDYLARQTKGRVTLVHPGMVLTFSARPGDSGDGLSWAANPSGDLVWTRLRTALTCSLPFPAAGPADERYEKLARRLAARLRDGWDTGAFLEAFDPRYLAGVEDRVGAGQRPAEGRRDG